ncbi:MAG: M23 family metallopeptidase [Clostridia bacterium]|nr:M23 family metallopeptidase [Clostridia bacterium]
MNLNEIKVESVNGSRVRTVSPFTIQSSEKPRGKSETVRTAVQIGVCALALVGAFTLRWVSVTVPDQVVAVSASQDTPVPSDAPGSLRFVESGTKKASPVLTNDVEILRDLQMARFTASAETVTASVDGRVSAIGSDKKYGEYLRLRNEDGTEWVLYGFGSITVAKNDVVAAGDTLGTVPIGRAVYLAIERDGKRQDPTAYVDLTIQGQRATA